MGLLSKVANLQNNAGVMASKKKNLIEGFFLDAKKLRTGFEYSGALFELLCRDLVIKKGSLLIPDNEDITFVPASCLNMDITTTRHLRIERIILETQFHHYNEIISSNDNRIKLFKQYFSIREFSALNSLMLVPFYMGGALSAILVIIDPKKETLEVAGEISLNSEKLINKLLNSRKPFFNLTKVKKKDININPVIVLQNFIDNNISEEITILIVNIQITNLKNAVIKLLPNTDSFEISNNIVSSIKSLIRNSGKLVEISSDQYVLFYKIKSGTTPGLVLHQINVAISSFFNLSVSLPEIKVDIRIFSSSENNSAESILEGII